MKNLFYIKLHSKTKNLLNLTIFIIIIFTFWTIYILFLDFYLKDKNLLYYQLFHLGLDKLLLMTLPTYFYLVYVEKMRPFSFLKLNRSIKAGLNYVILSIIFLTMLSLNNQYQLLNYINFNPFLSITIWIDAIILAAFMDEIIFRGVILQKLILLTTFKQANILSTLLFVFIHFPKWFSVSHFSHFNLIGSINFIFWFGLLMGYVFRKSNSLWPCIWIHLANNFISYALNL